MSQPSGSFLPHWTWVVPCVALAILAIVIVLGQSTLLAVAAGLALLGSVFSAVHHAEVVAHRVGEPFGTLVLAVAVTVIEVALIVSMMLAGGPDKAGLPRDTVFAAVMIICNGVVGMCLLAGGLRHREQSFQLQGALSALAVLAALVTLSLVLPNMARSAPGPFFTNAQLAFSGIASIVLYGSFVFIQTVRHRDYFLPPSGDMQEHAERPSLVIAGISLGLLLASLIAVIGLAKALTPMLEAGIDYVGAPKAIVGIAIAAMVLLPEGLSALRAAKRNLLQTSMNLALGSALASIGLTIPAVAVVSILIGQPLAMGLGTLETTLLALTLLLSVITLGTGRTTVLQGVVHLAVFAAFLFFSFVP